MRKFALHTNVILARVRVKPSFSQPGLMHLAGFEATERHACRFGSPPAHPGVKSGPFFKKWVPLGRQGTLCGSEFYNKKISRKGPNSVYAFGPNWAPLWAY